ncbi:hypothetical protein ASE04_19410 [Rhizobium sp. Root708]|uniref:lysozyme inhibitor LprI family protein n=1 Tax=Rhizobium sp. Root708 TaxID=1736592 RepID=UPI0006FC7F85|nr:hypothetical protein [Rhizobium sp. Root708]KRB62053.1 hypothetical protein ASE04_19410 [Rhizobium sp. Root708]
MRKLAWSIALLSSLFACSAVNGAGFNCSRAKTPDEKLVCHDPLLSHLDDLFNARYAANKKLASSNDDNHAARNFLADRRECRDDRPCVLSAYLAILWEISPDKNDFMSEISAQSLANGQQSSTSAIPTKIGQCTMTSVTDVHPRVGAEGVPTTDQDFDSGTGIDYANDGYQVSYFREDALIDSKAGDPVEMCLVEIDRDCDPDEDGHLFLVTNNRTHQTWILPEAQHKCGR